MASVSNDGRGLRRVQFVHLDGHRPSIRLGKVSQRFAEAFARRVEQFLQCMRLGQPMDAELATWASALDERTAAKLAKLGLIPARMKRDARTLGSLIRNYVDSRNDVKPASKEVWRQGEKGLCDYFGDDADIAAVTEGMAEDYKQKLIREGLATATIKKRLDFARQVFRSAVKHRWLSANPFTDVRIKVQLPDRSHFISIDDTERLIDACPNEDWRIIIALSRYAGLRCPSEVLSVRWADINWDAEEGVMHVSSPKTAHHPGKGSRVVPLFGLLRPHLQRAFEAAPDGAVYVVNESFREKALGPSGWRSINLRTQFQRIIKRAGLQPWPRLFHNLRSSRETELMADRRYSVSDVCRWMGHSMRIAERHYLQPRREAIRTAVAEETAKAAQNPAQQLRAGGSTERNWPDREAAHRPRSTAPCTSVPHTANPTSGEGGIRTRGPGCGETGVSPVSGAESGALEAELMADGLPAELAALWPSLSESARQELLEALRPQPRS